MIRYTKQALRNYLHELSQIDFMDFNRFIFQKLLFNILRFNTLLPVVAAIAVVAFSFCLQDAFYIFIPQSNITAFAMYMLFACVASLLLLILYPLVIIIVLNYVAYKLKQIFKKGFLPLKLLVLALAFYVCIKILTASTSFSEYQRFYAASLWILLYFALINLYISSIYHKENPGRISKLRVCVVALFVILLIKPFLLVFLYTSEKVNYTTVNPKIHLLATDCKLISTPISDMDDPKNLTINSAKYFQSDATGCYIFGNAVRYGFSSDYVLVFKKNINPIVSSDGAIRNAYVRLNCYSTTCYSDDNVVSVNNHDGVNRLIQLDFEKSRRNRMLLRHGGHVNAASVL